MPPAPEPSCSDSLRHPGFDRSRFTCHACRDVRPKPSPLIASRHYVTLETIAPLSDDPIVKLSAAVA
jgi:hypothetical protein